MFKELKDYIASHTKEKIQDTIYSKKDNKLIKSCVFLNTITYNYIN